MIDDDEDDDVESGDFVWELTGKCGQCGHVFCVRSFCEIKPQDRASEEEVIAACGHRLTCRSCGRDFKIKIYEDYDD